MKLNIDTDAVRQGASDKLDVSASQLIVNLEDALDKRSASRRQTLVDKINAMLEDEDSVDAFAAGTYAQDSSGQPAAQLGAGSAPSSEQEALDVLFNSPALSTGIKNALRRILDPRDPQVIAVDNDGTPTELASTRTQRDRMERERDDARTELSNERDENHTGSLKAQLVAAQAAATTPVDAVAKATVLPLIEAVETAETQLHSSMLSTTIDNRAELQSAIAAAKSHVS